MLVGGKPQPSRLNAVIDELWWMHIICFTLLLFSRMHYFKNVGQFSLSMQSVVRLLCIPIYLFVLYRSEFSLRKVRPAYNSQATWTDFKLAHTK